jgi:hypothetical protein
MAEFVSNRMLYIILRGLWCDIIFHNASTEDKTYDVKASFYEELERVFDQIPKYHTKLSLGNLNVKVKREHIFKTTIGNESLLEINNDNGIRVINFCRIRRSN